MSNHLFDLAEGAEITFQGPFGSFILRPPLRDTVFIATGTGIAPFRSMLHWLLADPSRHEGRQFWLLFGVRTEQDIYYREEFERLAGAALQLSFPADTQPRRAGVEGIARICAGTLARHRRQSHRYARLHLRTRQDGQRESRIAEIAGMGSEADFVREVRLKNQLLAFSS